MFEKEKKTLQVEAEGEIIVKIPRQLLPDFEELARSRGFPDSRAFLANFVRKQLALHFQTGTDSSKLSDIK
jgi:hypothetical protein